MDNVYRIVIRNSDGTTVLTDRVNARDETDARNWAVGFYVVGKDQTVLVTRV